MTEEQTTIEIETDPRFPTGPWLGFFLQPGYPGRHEMELDLNFSHGTLRGEGRDWVGEFLVRGRYDIENGKCHWSKRYVRAHDVFYDGYNEGKGIWGRWEIPTSSGQSSSHGGFYIWPKGMADPTGSSVSEEVDPPVAFEDANDDILAPQPVEEVVDSLDDPDWF